MAQTARAIYTVDIWSRPPANDTWPGKTDVDRWRWLIDHVKDIDVSLALFAARSRLSGMRCEDFCGMFLHGAKLAGWEGLEDWEGQGISLECDLIDTAVRPAQLPSTPVGSWK